MSVWQRNADVLYAQNTSFILSVDNLSAPTPQPINASGLFAAFDVFFGPDNTSLSQSDPQSSNAQLASALAAYFNPEEIQDVAATFLISILTITLAIVQPTYLNSNVTNNVVGDAPAPGLPNDFYVSLDFARTVLVGVIPQWTVIVYTLMSLIIFLCCVMGISLASLMPGPSITSFPIIDFGSRVTTNINADSLTDILTGLTTGKDGDVRLKFADKGLFLKHVERGPKSESHSDIHERKLGFRLKG
jgi:hypothetical protein